MNWNRTAVIAVIMIFSASFGYSSIRHMQLSSDVEQEKLAECAEQGGRDCHLISEFHDDCFDSSYRSEFRIREFRRGEYAECMSRKISEYGAAKDE